jgi:hypothetical protein
VRVLGRLAGGPRMLSAVNRVVFTGGPGAGKTSVLEALAALGHATVGDSARTIIAERLARGATRRPEETFVRTILRRDIEQYLAVADTSGCVFFDRGVIDWLRRSVCSTTCCPCRPESWQRCSAPNGFTRRCSCSRRGEASTQTTRNATVRSKRLSRCMPRWCGGTAPVVTFSTKCPPLLSRSAPSMSDKCLASRPSAELARTARAGCMPRACKSQIRRCAGAARLRPPLTTSHGGNSTGLYL